MNNLELTDLYGRSNNDIIVNLEGVSALNGLYRE